MDTSKIKNLIIIVLALVNIFLLTLVLADRSEAKAAEKAADKEIAHIFSNYGITLSEKIKVSGITPQRFDLHRDLEKEEKMVSAVLGKVKVENLGGNIYYYSSPDGQASFRGTGEFEMLLESGAVPAGGDPVHAARKLLGKMGIDSEKESAKLELSGEGETITVTLNASWKGDPIYNCQVTFVFKGGRLKLVMGRRPFDRISSSTEEGLLSAATVLMRFLDIINSGGHVCNKIINIEQGYVMDVSVPGDSVLCPVWMIETDVGKYYINGISGKPETISN
ncbi:MAG TPA: hypothetical protein GXZ52_01305 [Clostridiales bacterium]|jgi:hypothetical protein|nr:hypothetical protein [Clostridiales bacterium]